MKTLAFYLFSAGSDIRRYVVREHSCAAGNAFGAILNLGRPATQAEVSAATRDWIITQVQDYERRQNTQTFVPTPLPIVTATP